MENVTFATTFVSQLNNPDCSMMTGMVMGQWTTLKFLLLIAFVYMVFKVCDNVIIEPLLLKIKTAIIKHKIMKKATMKWRKN